ncbi:MAG: zinc dependent phospholipase C family protein, partial [Candidatus Thorarchaeota archaeon]
SSILFILIAPMFTLAIALPLATPVEAWGLVTHNSIAQTAMEHLSDDSWADAFDYYSIELLAGSTTPDQAWQDWDNHLYYPEDGSGSAPQAAAIWYEYAEANFTAGEWEKGFTAAGIMSHYACDPFIPIHTGPNWVGHSAFEGDINAFIGVFDIATPSESIVTNVSQLVVDGATYAHQYYDIIVEAYPTEDTRAIEDNSTLWDIAEDTLSRAIDACLSLFYNLTIDLDAPDVSYTYDYVASIDFAHRNDYAFESGGQKLLLVDKTLRRLNYEPQQQTTEFTAEALWNVNLLLITLALDTYSTEELAAITEWASAGNKGIIITSRGDYDESSTIASGNQVLEAIGSNIRMNDDNIYMRGTYRPHYNDLYTIPASAITEGLTAGVSGITMYSPSSLYFLDEDAVTPVLYADETAFQRSENPPGITVIFDDTNDTLGGDSIPLIAAEEIGDLRVLVSGTTFFSDFDYGKMSIFENIVLFENFLDWSVGSRPAFTPSTTPTTPTTPVQPPAPLPIELILMASIAAVIVIVGVVFVIRRR